MCLTYDIHLAATKISRDATEKLAVLGFERDQFVNLTCCHTGEYHGTYRGSELLPNEVLWQQINAILEADGDKFSGYLEQEMTEPKFRGLIEGRGPAMPPALPQLKIEDCPASKHKSCDLHVGINLTASDKLAVRLLDGLNLSSVDKDVPNQGQRRVYTITFESLLDGERVFAAFYEYLRSVPGLRGKLKLEKIVRNIRIPADAAVLPIATSEAVAVWLPKLLEINRRPRGTRAPSSTSNVLSTVQTLSGGATVTHGTAG
jgi:hypothetical protein